jgi:hypothetical protein
MFVSFKDSRLLEDRDHDFYLMTISLYIASYVVEGQGAAPYLGFFWNIAPIVSPIPNTSYRTDCEHNCGKQAALQV